VDRTTVTLEVQNEKGEIAFRKLDLSHLSANDLDSEFLERIGLTRFAPVIIAVQPGKAGERAGMQARDEVLVADGKPIASWEQLIAAVAPKANVPMSSWCCAAASRCASR
jgi:regulator of sigma E protease